MDARTKPISRDILRNLAGRMRKVFAVAAGGALPVLAMLDKISDVLPGCRYIVVEDSELPARTMAHCYAEGLGYTIEIKESVYAGAYEKNNGAFLGFICHEICHVFLFMNGYAPILERSFENQPVKAYCSVEWQAKALCGEVMVPFEESVGLNAGEIERRYSVSRETAKYRVKIGRRRWPLVANKKRINQLRRQLINAFGQMCCTAHAKHDKYSAFALFFKSFIGF